MTEDGRVIKAFLEGYETAQRVFLSEGLREVSLPLGLANPAAT